MDLRGFLGLSDAVPPGYEKIQMHFKVKANVPDDQLKSVLAPGPKFSPVFNSIARPVAVSVTFDNERA